jgi:hypothetical protein
MTTKRRKIRPTKINQPVPDWAVALLAGHLPSDPEGEDAFIGWRWLGENVPGLPPAMSHEGLALVTDGKENEGADQTQTTGAEEDRSAARRDRGVAARRR